MTPQSFIAYAIYRITVLRIRIYDFKGVPVYDLHQARVLRGLAKW